MQIGVVVRARDAGVTLHAAHSFVDVRAMLERMRSGSLSNAENARASREH
jgi:hypothetical protein